MFCDVVPGGKVSLKMNGPSAPNRINSFVFALLVALTLLAFTALPASTRISQSKLLVTLTSQRMLGTASNSKTPTCARMWPNSKTTRRSMARTRTLYIRTCKMKTME